MSEDYNKKIENLIKEYKGKTDLYKDFGKSMVLILENLLLKDEFYMPIVISREKNIDSLRKKLVKKNDKGEIYIKEKNINTLNDIEDLAGVRAIFYLESEANKFINYIYEEFGRENILIHKSKIKEKGYNATHLIIRLNNERLQLSEYCKYQDLRCEIQITTLLDHAWSEIEHRIVYKPEEGLESFDKNIHKTIKESFDNIMEKHIKEANQEFEAINHLYKELKTGKEIFDLDFLKNISLANSNNEIHYQLELLEKYSSKFSDKIPKDFRIIKVLEDVITKTKNNKVEEERTAFGNLPGKTHDDIVLRILEIVNHLRYSRFPESFNLLIKIYSSSSEVVQNEIIRIVENVSKYNYGLIKKNIFIQRDILNKLLQWTNEKQLDSFRIVETIGKELLEPSFDGMLQTAENTFTIQSGHLNPSENYKKLRRETIVYLLNLYKNIENIELRIRLLKVLNTASNFPINSVYNDDYEMMIKDDVNFLINEYRDIILDKDDKIKAEPPIVKEIENQLKWFNRRFKNKLENCGKIILVIKEDKFYNIFRLLVSDIFDYQENNEGWEVAETKKIKGVDDILNSINSENLESYISIFEKIAEYKDLIEEHKFFSFKTLLRKIAENKPEIAEKIIKRVFEKKSFLKPFINEFFCGFRSANKIELWEKYSDLVVKDSDVRNLGQLLNSLLCVPKERVKELITDNDINLLKDIINGNDRFVYYKDKIFNDYYFTFVLMQILLFINNKNQKEVENLIITLFKETTNEKYLSSYYREIDFALKQKTFSIDNWQDDSVDFLVDVLINLTNLDYSEQEVILEIGKKDYDKMMSIFISRIKNDYRKSESRDNTFHRRYEAIPFHFNGNLAEFIGNNDKFKNIINDWINETTIEKRISNWELGRFIKRVRGPINDILLEIIENADDEKLLKIVDLFEMNSVPNFDLSLKIIEKTNDKKVWNKVMASLYRTGVVSGEYGLANAYENKLKGLQKYKEKYKKENNEDVLKFIDDFSKDLKDSIIREKRRVDEELKIRKLKYKSGL